MNVYDFDQTVFWPDSSFCFVKYCLRHYPRAVLSTLPGVGIFGLLRLMEKAETKDLKERIFSFLPLPVSVFLCPGTVLPVQPPSGD